VKDAQDADLVVQYDIGGDIGRARNDQLSRARYTANAAAFWELHKPAGRDDDPLIDTGRCYWVVSFDMSENLVSVEARDQEKWTPVFRPITRQI